MKTPSTTKLGQLRMSLTMVILAVFLLLYTYICSAPPLMPGGQKWRSNTFSPALKLQTITSVSAAKCNFWCRVLA
jgi:hypothetical protein